MKRNGCRAPGDHIDCLIAARTCEGRVNYIDCFSLVPTLHSTQSCEKNWEVRLEIRRLFYCGAQWPLDPDIAFLATWNTL